MWLVFDVGSGSTKVALIAEGEILRSASAAYPTDFGDGGEAEQNASDWWAAVKRVCHELDAPTLLAGIVLTGQMQDVILLDENAAPVRPVVLYSDTRATAQIERIHQLVSPDELRAITGIEQSAGSLLAKLRWLDENERQSLKHASHLLFGGADFIAARMTGSFVSDSTTASTTGLWHLAEDTLLDAKLLTRLELAQLEILLPTVVSGGSCVGSLNEAAAQSLNLQAGTPVYLAPGDAGTATIGAGCGEPGAAYAYVGTSGWVAFTAREIGAASAGVITLAHPRPNHFIQVVPMMTSAGNLDWLQGIFDSISYDEIIRQALDREPSNLVFFALPPRRARALQRSLRSWSLHRHFRANRQSRSVPSSAGRHDLRLPPYAHRVIAAVAGQAHADRRWRSKSPVESTLRRYHRSADPSAAERRTRWSAWRSAGGGSQLGIGDRLSAASRRRNADHAAGFAI